VGTQNLISKIRKIFIKNKTDLSELLTDEEFKSFLKGWFNLNRWALFLYIIFITTSMAFYVNNVISINNLLKDIKNLELDYSELENKNKILISKVIELQEADRICRIAENNLNMIKNNKAPIHIK